MDRLLAAYLFTILWFLLALELHTVNEPKPYWWVHDLLCCVGLGAAGLTAVIAWGF